MAAPSRDKLGRPIVAVTGIGVVTSLGVGKSDNWAKLTGGMSGIKRISRFPTEGLRTTIAGAVNDVYRELDAARGAVRARRHACRRRSDRRIRHRQQGSLSRAALSRTAAARNRMARPDRDGGNGRFQRRHRLSRPHARCQRIRRQKRRVQIRHHRRTSRRAFRHRGLAGFAQHRLRFRRQRDPARHGGDTARRVRSSARDRR